MKKWHIVGRAVLVAAIGFGAWRLGSRMYFLLGVSRDAAARHRIASIPTELKFSDPSEANHVEMQIGYASFEFPSSQSIQLEVSGDSGAIAGTTETLTLLFLPPFDPRLRELAPHLMATIDKSSERHVLLSLWSPSATALDMLIQTERALPPSWWTVLFYSDSEFRSNAVLLMAKAVSTGCGMNSVRIFTTPAVRGLVLVGKTVTDTSTANVSLESRSGDVAVGILARLREGTQGDVVQELAPILRTFRFTVRELGDRTQIKELVSRAGVRPGSQRDITQ